MPTLPVFRYHPDPVASGSVHESREVCACCGVARGYVYAGPVYAVDELDDKICPWCIADGKAHKKFDATFTGSTSIPFKRRVHEVPRWALAPAPVGLRLAGGRILGQAGGSSEDHPGSFQDHR
jgi:uncharacterized protein CbrC (UPF0167 family)